jgi:hypothetical protein
VATTLVVGAGASLANALHFHGYRKLSENPPLDNTFFERVSSRGIRVPLELRKYASSFAAVDPFSPVPGRPAVRVEEFFKELFGDFQDGTGGSIVNRAYPQMINMYVRLLRETTNWLCEDSRTGSPVGRLIADLAADTDDLTVLTFNHDLVIENEIYKRARLRKRWCLTEGYGSFGSSLPVTTPTSGSAQLFPVHGSSCDHSAPITILKLHGSLNWYVRLRGRMPTRSNLAGIGTTSKVTMTRRRMVQEQLTTTITRPGRGRATWYTWPVVIPPISEKDALIRSNLSPVWADARQALTRADRIVFCGYSLPMLDLAAERLFQRSLTATRAPFVELIDPSPAVPGRYAALAPITRLRWYPSLDSFLSR